MSIDFDLQVLRRFPDLEADNLVAVDATDRLVLAEAERFRQLPMTPVLFDGATVVLGQLPKNLDALREIAQLAAAHADPDVTVFLGGRVKHMTHTMNEVLGDSFAQVRASLAHQKSRILVASGPLPAAEGGAAAYPLRTHHLDLDLWVCAHGAVFAGAKLDIGTRFLLDFLDRMHPFANTAVDLGCGTGVLAAALARARPQLSVLATDQSAGAVLSAAATMAANGLTERVHVLRDDAMSTLPDASVDLIVCNPPFHLGTSVHAGAAIQLFDAAGRVLAPGGELWTVFNSHLAYAGALNRAIGSTRVVGSNAKFTVTVSTRTVQGRPKQGRSARD